MDEKATVVQGYTLLERRQAGEVMIALGYHPKAPQPYVTWKAYEHDNFQSFNHGHYFSTREEAMADYFRRLSEAWENYSPARSERPKRPEKPKPPKRGGMDR